MPKPKFQKYKTKSAAEKAAVAGTMPEVVAEAYQDEDGMWVPVILLRSDQHHYARHIEERGFQTRVEPNLTANRTKREHW